METYYTPHTEKVRLKRDKFESIVAFLDFWDPCKVMFSHLKYWVSKQGISEIFEEGQILRPFFRHKN